MPYKHAEDRRRRENERRREAAEWLADYKSRISCLRCGERHPACLQFHHRDAAEKEFSVSNAVCHGWAIARIEREIAKCDVLCANCHARHHWRERNPTVVITDIFVTEFSIIGLDTHHGASQQTQAGISRR